MSSQFALTIQETILVRFVRSDLSTKRKRPGLYIPYFHVLTVLVLMIKLVEAVNQMCTYQSCLRRVGLAMYRTSPLFSVLIVNYNSGQHLRNAVNSLKNQTFRDFELIILDNHSDDSSLDNLGLEALPDARLIAEQDNHGFAKGNNIAAQSAKGDWLVLLNPDAIAAETWLEEIKAAIGRHPTCQVFASNQHKMDEPGLLDGAGDAYFAFGIPWRGGYEHPTSVLPTEDSLCFSPCGASAVYKRDLFLSIGGFDERFFCYCEDVDIGMRLQLSNQKCIFLPRAIVQHKGSATTGRSSYFTMYHGFRNRTFAYLKNMPLSMLVVTLPVHILLMVYIYLRNRTEGHVEAMRDGMRDGLKDGFRLRRQGLYKVKPDRRGTWNLMRSMAWNPVRLSRRGLHLRSL